MEKLPDDLQELIVQRLSSQDVLNLVRAKYGWLPPPTPAVLARIPRGWKPRFFWSSAVHKFLTFLHDHVSDTAFFKAKELQSVVLVADYSPFATNDPPRPLATWAWVQDARPSLFDVRRMHAQLRVDMARLIEVMNRVWTRGGCSVRLGIHGTIEMQSGQVFNPTPLASTCYHLFPASALGVSPAWCDESLGPCEDPQFAWMHTL